MSRRLLAISAIAALAMAAVSVTLAATDQADKAKPVIKVSAALNIGQERPHPKGTKAGASGRFTGTLSGTTLAWTLTYRQLSGPATQAHIHAGARGKSGPVVVPLCGTTPACSTGMSGTATLTAGQVQTLRSGGYYVNVHTAKNPNGEIRGQLTRSPAAA
jgi:hypothetical protein